MENDNIKLPKKIAAFLDKSGVKFETIGHRTVYTAYDKAATLKVKPAAIVKVLVVKMDKELAMAVIGGDRSLDIEKLQKASKSTKLDFAKEKVIAEAFKGVDPGTMPPFSGLWPMKVFCDKKLLESPKLILSAGAYECSIKIAPGAFKKINPEMAIGIFSKAKEKKAKSKPKPKTVSNPKKRQALNKKKK